MLRRDGPDWAVGTVVPDHKELRQGTLKGIPKLARVDERGFNRLN